MKTRQDYIVRILESRKIIFEQIDISDQSQESEKAFMRKHSTAKEGQKVPLPPQIFFDDQYCGVCTSQGIFLYFKYHYNVVKIVKSLNIF